jgi:hypothetical protein
MKLTEKNAKFAVIKIAFYNGGTISFHISLAAAERAAKKFDGDSEFSCCGVVPVTRDAASEMMENDYYYNFSNANEIMLYADYPEYTANSEHYSQLCR